MQGDFAEDGGGHAGHTASSFTDLMASLMVIFILLFVATVNNANAERERVRSELLKTLQTQLAPKGIPASSIYPDKRDPYAIVLVMPDSLLFERDSSRVRENGQKKLEEVTPILLDVLCSEERKGGVESVVVEGHTDTTYAGFQRNADSGRAHNLRLSQARSMAVVENSLKTTFKRDAGERACFRQLLSASGRGQEEPLDNLPGDDGRQRRVVFKFRVAAVKARDLADTLKGSGKVDVLP